MNKRLGVMFMVLAYFLLLGGTYFFAKPVNNKVLENTDIKEDSSDKITNNITNENNNEDLKEDCTNELTSLDKNGVHVFSYEDNYTFFSKHVNKNGSNKPNCYSFTIETDNESAKGIKISKNNQYFLFYDNGVKLYDINSKKTVLIDIDDSDFKIGYFDNLYFVQSDSTGDVSGIGSLHGFYSFSLGKVIYKDKGYENYDYQTQELVSAYYSNNTDSYFYLLKTNEEKIFLQSNSVWGYSAEVVNDNFIVVAEYDFEGPYRYKFYNKNYVRLDDDFISSYEYNFESEYLYVIVDNSLYRYDKNGNYEVLGTYEKLFQIFEDNSIAYLKDGYLHYENLNHNISKDVLKWESKYKYNPCQSYSFDNSAHFDVTYHEEEDDNDYTLLITMDLKTQKIVAAKEEGSSLGGAC